MAEKMSAQLRVKGECLAEVTEKAGRKLPRRLRKDAAVMIQAETMSAHPKLSRLVNSRQLSRAEKRLNRFLDKQDPAAERRGEILDLIAKIAFVLVTVVLAIFFFLLSRGYLT
jgi:biopolymer transport protein ExbB/TolQ